jgi:hypothetical protein
MFHNIQVSNELLNLFPANTNAVGAVSSAPPAMVAGLEKEKKGHFSRYTCLMAYTGWIIAT